MAINIRGRKVPLGVCRLVPVLFKPSLPPFDQRLLRGFCFAATSVLSSIDKPGLNSWKMSVVLNSIKRDLGNMQVWSIDAET